MPSLIVEIAGIKMTTPAKPPDEFDAIRVIYETLKPFQKEEQQRLLRWVQEKLGLAVATTSAETRSPATHDTPPPTVIHHVRGTNDIKSFMDAKNPKSDNQFAAAVAYFYKFEAPDDQKKESITPEDVLTACRLVHRKRPGNTSQVLINAHHQGLLDKTGERGQYRINSVGENLVAMVLPNQDGGGGGGKTRQAKKTNKKSIKKKRAGK